jgi:hypothetical protein
MKRAGLIAGFLALTLVLLPALTAQEKDKKDKAEPEKKEPAAKEKKPVEEKPEHGQIVKTKILSMRPDSAREFTIEVQTPDPQKMFQLQQSLSQARTPLQYQQIMAQANIYSAKPVDVRAAEGCKVRTMFPPVQYDDAGNLKKWSKKELAELKKNSKLPGFPADFDVLKTGQWVELYLAKQPKEKAAAKDKAGANPKKKKMDDDDPLPAVRPEVVMIVIWSEPTGR